MKKILCFIFIIMICITNGITVYGSEAVNLLPSEIPIKELDSSITSYVEKNSQTTAAMSVAVFTSEDILLEKSYGYIDREKQVKNDQYSVFECGSCTKLLTWVSVMQLAEKGKIDLTGDIRTYLPEGFLRKVKYDAPITMLNLMNHNAGWQETVTDLFLENKDDIMDLGDALRYIEPEQVNEPGTIVAYSNWGTALAGYIVECVSGIPFSEYVRKNIFEPLGMKHTALSADLSDNPWVYEKRISEKCYTSDNQSLGTSFYYLSLYPAGAATGTLDDFIIFASAFMPKKDEASPLFTKADTLKEMLSPSLYYGDKVTARNCHGFWTDQFEVPVLWHNGGTIGSSSWFAFDPDSGVGMIVLTNQSDESIYNCGLLPFVFGKVDNTGYSNDISNTEDISGIYVNSRSCFRGYAKLYSLFTVMPFESSGMNTYHIPGSEISVSGLSNHSYRMDMGGLKQFFLYADTDNKGNTLLQSVASDYIQINGYKLLMKYALLLLFLLAGIYSIVAVFISLIKLILHKKSKAFGLRRKLVNIASIINLGLFLSIAYKLMTSSSAMYQSIEWRLICCAVLAFVPILFTISLVVQWRHLTLTRKEKVILILDTVIGLLVSINVYYWEI